MLSRLSLSYTAMVTKADIRYSDVKYVLPRCQCVCVPCGPTQCPYRPPTESYRTRQGERDTTSKAVLLDFLRCITGLLAKFAVILVTNQLQNLRCATEVLCLQEVCRFKRTHVAAESVSCRYSRFPPGGGDAGAPSLTRTYFCSLLEKYSLVFRLIFVGVGILNGLRAIRRESSSTFCRTIGTGTARPSLSRKTVEPYCCPRTGLLGSLAWPPLVYIAKRRLATW